MNPPIPSVRTRMDQFWDSWQELSVYPESRSSRQSVLTRGETLVDSIHQQYKGLQGIRDMVNGDIEGVTKQVNDYARQIAALNEEIVKVKAMGDSPNDLMDSRDLLVEKLSGLINITVDQRDPDEFVVHTAGLELVQGKSYRTFDLKTGVENDGYAKVVWADSRNEAHFSGGKLGALIELRDGDLRDEIQKLDTMTMNFVDLVNDIHRDGTGANGKTGVDFFTEQNFINNVSGNYDRNGDGQYDSSYIFRVTGANALSAREQIGLEGNLTLSAPTGTVSVPYHPTDMVADVVSRINNSGAEVVASFDRDGHLVLKGTTAQNKENPRLRHSAHGRLGAFPRRIRRCSRRDRTRSRLYLGQGERGQFSRGRKACLCGFPDRASRGLDGNQQGDQVRRADDRRRFPRRRRHGARRR